MKEFDIIIGIAGFILFNSIFAIGIVGFLQ